MLALLLQSVWAAGYRPHRHMAPQWQPYQRQTSATESGSESPTAAQSSSAPSKAVESQSAASPSVTAALQDAGSDLVSAADEQRPSPSPAQEAVSGSEQPSATTAPAEVAASAITPAAEQTAVPPSAEAAATAPSEAAGAPTTPAETAATPPAADAAAVPAAASEATASTTTPPAEAEPPSTEAATIPAAEVPPTAAVPPPAAADPLAGMPYDLDQLQDLEALLEAHKQHQESVLSEQKKGVPAMKVETGIGHGLGNRVPGIATGFVMALLTGRIFLLQSTVHQHWDFPLPCVWQDYESLYEGVDRCDFGHFSKFVNPELKFCGGPGENRTAPLLMQPCQFDYMVPMLQINPVLKPYFEKFFPDGEVFHKVARYLFHPKPALAEAMQPYLPLVQDCIVGMHMRTKKPGTGVSVTQFAAIARSIMSSRPGNVFVAADDYIFSQVQKLLPGREVWWSNSSATELQQGNTTAAGNPGTELSAMLDLMLLSKCKNVILTPSSSIGGIAAGIAGVPPVFANTGQHTEPYTNPWFWRAVTSEPCFVKASVVHRMKTPLAIKFKEEHPLFVYHNQCHFDFQVVGYPTPTWECTPEACREF